MLKILITVLFFVLNTISLKAEIVKDVKISGNTRVSEETINQEWVSENFHGMRIH